jgi:hypothetical protein
VNQEVRAPGIPAGAPAGPGFWNFGFFMLDNGLPDRIVSGREDTWVAGFVDWREVVKGSVGSDAVGEYAAYLLRRRHMAASYAYFRAFPRQAEATVRSRETPLAMPVLVIGGEDALGQSIPNQMQSTSATSLVPCSHAVTGSRRKARNSYSNTCWRSSANRVSQFSSDLPLRTGRLVN